MARGLFKTCIETTRLFLCRVYLNKWMNAESESGKKPIRSFSFDNTEQYAINTNTRNADFRSNVMKSYKNVTGNNISVFE